MHDLKALAGGVTLEDVAIQAKVSVSTVSRALTRPERVSKKTRERVLKAAQALGYAPNQLARSLRQRGSRTIGLIISDIQVAFHSEVAKGVEDTAQAHGYTIILCNSDENSQKEQTYLELLKGFRVGGIILEPTDAAVPSTEAIVRSGVPVIEVDHISGAKGVTSVLSENVLGAGLAATHLLGLGHTRIGVIAGEIKLTSGRERLQGFVETLEHAGVHLPESLICTAKHNNQAGYEAAKKVLQHHPSALFVASSVVMVGVMRAIRELGLRIPTDLSLIGFDDAEWATLTDPPITVIAQNPYLLGKRATELILSRLETGHNPANPLERGPDVLRLPTWLIERQSCAKFEKRS